MRTLSFSDPLPHRCTRIIVAGTSGAGKTTFAEQLACIQDLPRFEMDNLRWGPPRSAFLDEALAAASSDSWVTEWQYPAARPALARRAHAMIWLDYSVPRRMYWVTRRTLIRRATRQSIWDAGLTEDPLRTFFTDNDHIIRSAWRTRRHLDHLPGVVEREYPHLALYRFTSPSQSRRWLRALSA